MNNSKILEAVTRAGKSLFPDFVIEKAQEQFYINLFCYFKGLPGVYDLSKGLLISGSVGTGKTTSMKVMQLMFRNFNITNTRYLIRDYRAEKTPTKIIDMYGRDSYKKAPEGHLDKTKPQTYCFDDFGLENVNVKTFGHDQNVMEEVILDRYDEWKSRGMLTFGTTNLQPKQIEENYGGRVRDRLKEMMNYIILDGASKRK